MKILHLLRTESDLSLPWVVFLSAISGLTNALLLIILNVAVEDTAADSHTFPLLVLFMVSLAIFILTRKAAMIQSTTAIENALHRVRTRIADKIRRSDLQPLERIGRSQLYAAVQRETLTISKAARPLLVTVQTATLFLFTVTYIAWLSVPAFLLFNGILLAATIVHLAKRKEIAQKLGELLQRQNKVFDCVTHILDGFKEVKLNKKRSADLYAHTQLKSTDATDLKVDIETQFINLSMFGQTALYTCVAMMAFMLPEFSPDYHQVSIKVTTAFLFIIGPILSAIGAIPEVASAQVAVQEIYDVEAKLDEQTRRDESNPGREADAFQAIGFDNVTFQFKDPRTTRPFTVGPINLDISAGDMLFITGGNGSGKSTFLKLLTALYYPHHGYIRFDGRELDEKSYYPYRSLFSAVFWDYHLFDRLYGMEEVGEERIEALLEEFELKGKTRYVDGQFETLDLSTGQKKRLALLVAILEDRPIYVFDEWAADQDPIFRRHFYEKILPRLKERGKTVIAVTHDDKYYDAADRVLHMQDGQFVT